MVAVGENDFLAGFGNLSLTPKINNLEVEGGGRKTAESIYHSDEYQKRARIGQARRLF